MKLLKIFGVLVALAGVAALAIVFAPSVYRPLDSRALAQDRPFDSAQGRHDGWFDHRALTMLAGRGAAIGVSIRDSNAGVEVEEVRPDTPAEKAGLKRGDIFVEFDGEHVRSARQFTRLVQETTPGRTVKATVLRDGKRTDVQITPTEHERRGDLMISGDFGDYFRDLGRDLGRLGDHLPPFSFDFDFDWPSLSGRRLGINVQELTDQLANYFGVRDGVLVTSVTDGSAASRAGLKAGDVITSINGRRVESREDLMRELRDADRNARTDSVELTIGIMRDKKESSVKAMIDASRRPIRGRPA